MHPIEFSDPNGQEIDLTGVTADTNANLFISVNGVYVGSLWLHEGKATWGHHDDMQADWVPRETVVFGEREHRHQFQGQVLIHSHAHQGPHGYFEHPEDIDTPDGGYDTDVPYLDLGR